jgi:hypothetical protein
LTFTVHHTPPQTGIRRANTDVDGICVVIMGEHEWINTEGLSIFYKKKHRVIKVNLA